MSLHIILAGLVAPLWGRWTDRRGARTVVIAGGRLTGLTLMEAMGTLSFWMIAVGFSLPMMATVAIMMHLVPIITDMGTPAQAAPQWPSASSSA